MASTHNESSFNPIPYIGISVLAVLFAATLDSCSPDDSKAAEAPAASTTAASAPKAPAVSAESEANIKPIGTVIAADKTPPAAARGGEEVYNTACAACHTAGVMNAPKLDKASWEPRIAKGLDGLVHSAINGLNAMPPRGGNPAITDEEINNAVSYMTKQAGYDLASGAAATAQAAAPAAPEATAQAAAPAAPEATAQTAAPAAPEAPAPAAAPVAPAAPEAPTQVAALKAPASDGEAVYRSICFSCHDVGIANSPIIGDKAAWTARIASGNDALYGSVINGKGVMPARGGNPALSDEQLKAAVDYMVMKAGGTAAEASQQTAPAAPAVQDQAAPAAAPEQTAPPPAAPEAAPAQAAPGHAGIDGHAVYKGICFSCHDAGVLNAPKPGDKAAWAPRIAAGVESLYNHSINGFNIMPAKGGNPALSDDEVKAAVDWMAAQSQ